MRACHRAGGVMRGRPCQIARRALNSPLRRFLWYATVIKGAPTCEIEDVKLIDASENVLEDAARVLGAAIVLIDNTQPYYGRMLRRHVRSITILLGRPMYLEMVQSIVLPRSVAGWTDIVETACVLIHEATHARIHAAGHRYTPENRVRIEAICVRAELDFLQFFPARSDLAKSRRDAMEAVARTTTYEAKAAHARRFIEALREAGASAWLLKTARLLRWRFLRDR